MPLKLIRLATTFTLALTTSLLLAAAPAHDPTTHPSTHPTSHPSTHPTSKPSAHAIPPGVKVERDIEYIKGGGKSQSLDLYLPEKHDHPLPLIIFVHGGGWSAGDKFPAPGIAIVPQGYAFASINYRLSGQAKFPAQIEDCKAAIRWLRANAAKYNFDTEHFGAWGGSAGGHLVALLGTASSVKEWDTLGGNVDQSSKVQCVCDWFGPTDFLQIVAQSGPDSQLKHEEPTSPEAILLGGTIDDQKEKATQANPIIYITKDSPPFLIMHGDRDPLVPLGQSEILKQALDKAGVEATLKVIKNAGHGGPAFGTPENVKLMKDFFDKHLKPATPATKPTTQP